MLTDGQRRFLDCCRVGRLATADRTGRPHVVPVCYAIRDEALYITLDEKPKRQGITPKRLRNLAENPEAAVIVDHYDDDWSRLGWIMLRGRAEILRGGEEHDAAQMLLRGRYPQYRMMDLCPLAVIALRISRVTTWGAIG